MADATLPIAGTYTPGHQPFWLRVRHEQRSPGRIVGLVAIDGDRVTIDDDGTRETYWTHAPAIDTLRRALEAGVDRLSRYGKDVFILQGVTMSLVDPSHASRCAEPDECRRGRLISVRTGEPWDIEDTLAANERDRARDGEPESDGEPTTDGED